MMQEHVSEHMPKVEDMFPERVSILDGDFQQKISSDSNFAIFGSKPNEKLLSNEQGTLFNHQQATKEYLKKYDRLLIMDEPGTGKTCSVAGFTELVSTHISYPEEVDGRLELNLLGFEKVIVLVKGNAQEADFKNQLVCKCAKAGRYRTQSLHSVTIDTGKVYEIYHYATFANKIKREGIKSAAKQFSNKIIWIDEGHNLIKKGSDDELLPVSGKSEIYGIINELAHSVTNSKIIISTATVAINHPPEFGLLMNILLPLPGQLPPDFDPRILSDRALQVLFPGIPEQSVAEAMQGIWDVDEWASFYEPQIPEDFDYVGSDVETYGAYCQGYLTYSRSLETGVVNTYRPSKYNEILPGIMDPDLEDQEIPKVEDIIKRTVHVNVMSEHQTKYYSQIDKANITENMDYSLVVYPDGTSGNKQTEDLGNVQKKISRLVEERKNTTDEDKLRKFDERIARLQNKEDDLTLGKGIETGSYGFDKYFKKDKNDYYEVSSEMRKFLTKKGKDPRQIISQLRILSATFAEIAEIEYQAEGKAAIYSSRLNASGANELGAYFRMLGFDIYNPSEKKNLGGRRKKSSFCGSRDEDEELVDIGMEKKKRLAIIHGQLAMSKIRDILRVYNSPQNIDGEYISKLIFTATAREGVNFSEVRRYHDTYGDFTESNMYQGRSRTNRATSHLITLARKKAAGEKAEVELDLYYHCAVPGKMTSGRVGKGKGRGTSGEEALGYNYRVYKIAFSKDIPNMHLMRMLKRVSVTCLIHYRRNVRPGDRDLSRECEYKKCAYKCMRDPPSEISDKGDVTNFPQELKDSFMYSLQELLKVRPYFTSKELSILFAGVPMKRIHAILSEIVMSKHPFTDRFGLTTFLHSTNGVYFTRREYPTSKNYDPEMYYYTQGMIFHETTEIADIVKNVAKSNIPSIFEEISTLPSLEATRSFLYTLPFKTQVLVLEAAMKDIVENNPRLADVDILKRVQDIYSLMVYHIPLPDSKITQEAGILSKITRGRPRKAGGKTAAKEEEIVDLKEYFKGQKPVKKLVVVHTMLTQDTELHNYGRSNRFMSASGANIRILDPKEISGERGWRSANEDESIVIRKIVSAMNIRRLSTAINQDIYAFRLVGDTLLIVANPECATGNKKGCLSKKFGKSCDSWDIVDLYKIVYILGAAKTQQKIGNITVAGMKEFISKSKQIPYRRLNNWPDDLVEFVYSMASFVIRNERDTLCSLIEKELKSRGAYYDSNPLTTQEERAFFRKIKALA